jgi:glutamate 5-kinase
MRNLGTSRRIVVKIGTNILSGPGGIDEAYVDEIARQIANAVRAGREVLLVSSGAIGLGARELGIEGKVTSITMRQACAATGQPVLMNTYKAAFQRQGLQVAQVLLTREVLENRRSYVNARNAVETLLSLGTVPVFNENDSISTEEIGTAFGDNDRLSALVASKVDAELLVMLTDIDALYDRDPRQDSHAQPIRTVSEITDEITRHAGKPGSSHATGGMETKLKAVRIASRAGCHAVIANGKEPDVLTRILADEELGTIFLAKERLKNRSRWILNAKPQGRIIVDEGALAAIRNHNSLLPTGVTGVEGVFRAGSVVEVRCPECEGEVAKLVSALNSTDLERVIGKHLREAQDTLGPGKKEIIARPEDIVFLQD